MVKFHKQRLTVLLFVWSFLFMMLSSYYFLRCSWSQVVNFELMSVSSNYMTMSVLIDKVSVSFGCVVTLISSCVFMFGRWYMKDDPFYYRFVWILLSFVLSMNVLIFSGSLLIMLVGWDGLGVSSFALIIYYQSKESLGAGFLTLLVNRIGDILIMSVMFYFVLAGSSLLLNYPAGEVGTMLFVLSMAAMTKSAQYPFSAWLPAAMAAPTPVSALVHSSTLVTAGIYILIRSFMTMELSNSVSSLLLFCGSITSMVGGLCAVYENDLKKVVAFSTLSQLGIMVFSLGLGSASLALLHLYTHAMFKALLFLVAGCILLLAYGVQDIRMLGAVTKGSPILLVFLNISTLCLMGVPFLSAFYSKHTIISLMLSGSINMFAVLVMLCAVFLTSVYMIRLIKMLNWSVSIQPMMSETGSHVLLFYMPMMLLFLGSLLLGWVFSMGDIMYVYGIFIPQSRDLMMNVLLLVSVISGLSIYKSRGIQSLTKMFYMDPFWNSINTLSNKLSIQLKSFEGGWVEPNAYSGSVKSLVFIMSKNQWWPTSNMSFIQHLIMIMIVIYVMWLYLK